MQGVAMYRVAILNEIDRQAIELLESVGYELTDMITDDVEAVVLRSHQLRIEEIPPKVLAVARAGVGVNNIPIDELSSRGVPVFNTPGANANAVKELTLLGMMLAARNIVPAIRFVNEVIEQPDLDRVVEKSKKDFAGFELQGHRLLVIGLGAIGSSVALAAVSLGMQVHGYDPDLQPARMSELDGHITLAQDFSAALSQADFISLHLPLIEGANGTANLIDQFAIDHISSGRDATKLC